MGKGTRAFGRHNKEGNHIRCRRCGRHSYHKKKKVCAACGFGESARLRRYNWSTKSRPSYGRKTSNNRRAPYQQRVKNNRALLIKSGRRLKHH